MRFLKNKRLIAGVVIVLAIVAMAMWPESIEVSSAKVVQGPMQVTVDEDGETRVRDKFVVSAKTDKSLSLFLVDLQRWWQS